MATVDDRLRCWAAGVEVSMEVEAAHENARNMLELVQSGADPNTSQTYHVEAANYSLHLGAAEEGIRQAEACGEFHYRPGELSWVGEFRRQSGILKSRSTTEADAHSRFDAVDSVIDWLRRDTAGIPEPKPSASSDPHVVVLDTNGYALLHGTKGDVSTFVRMQDGEIEWNLYPPGKGPRNEEEASRMQPIDGGIAEANTPEDLRAFERMLKSDAGVDVRVAVPRGFREG
jgi:hypothetical protein